MAGLSTDQLQQVSHLASRIARDEFLPEDAFRIILELATDLTRSDLGSIHLIDDQRSTLRLAAIKGSPEKSIVGAAYPLENSLTGRTVRTGKPIMVKDVAQASEYTAVFPHVRSELVVPIIVGDNVIGVINLESTTVANFTEEDARVVELAASLLASAVRSGELSRLRSKLQASGDPHQPQQSVFVLMPFREPFNKYYKTIFRPAVEQAGLRPLRADEIFGPSEIMQDLWGSIREARVVLAELTGRNPNVMYEVGLSHGIGKPVILVAQSMDDVPFDLRGLRCVLYDTTEPDWASELRLDLTHSIQSAVSSGVVGPFRTRGSETVAPESNDDGST